MNQRELSTFERLILAVVFVGLSWLAIEFFVATEMQQARPMVNQPSANLGSERPAK